MGQVWYLIVSIPDLCCLSYSNATAFGELGGYPLYIDAVIEMIKYWLHLHTVDQSQNKLLNEAFKDNCSMLESNNDCWLHCVYLICREVNMLNVLTTHTPLAKTLVCLKKKLKQRKQTKK